MKQNNIKFYDCLEMKTVSLNKNEVKKYFNENVGLNYLDVNDFMEIHFISKKHKTFLISK